LAALIAATIPTAQAAEFDCVLEPRQTVELRSPVAGLIARVSADRGQFVKAGEVVVELDSGVERATLDMARHKATMQGAIRSGESRLAFAKLKLERRDNLVKQNYMARQDREETETETRLAESELQDAHDNLRLTELDQRRNEELLRLRSITSPIAGVVTERNLNPGEMADPSEGRRPILKIADIAILHAEAIAPAAAYPYIRIGQKASVRADSPVRLNATGVVRVVDRVLDAASGTFGIRLEVANADLSLPAGIHCRVEFPQVPAAAVPARRAASGGH
jgi:RND family efflux transporter MFP subunit